MTDEDEPVETGLLAPRFEGGEEEVFGPSDSPWDGGGRGR